MSRNLTLLWPAAHPHSGNDSEGVNFNMLKGESLIECLEERVHRQYTGGCGGFSICVVRGLHYPHWHIPRPPRGQRRPRPIDRGTLGITNLGIYFGGQVKVFRVACKKIVAFVPCSDAVQIERDGASANPQVF